MVTIAVAEAFSSLGPWTAALGVAEAVAETIVISLAAYGFCEVHRTALIHDRLVEFHQNFRHGTPSLGLKSSKSKIGN